MQEASSVADCGISTMNKDICRHENYTATKGGESRHLIPAESESWKFSFPDGERLETGSAKQGNIPRVGEKIRQLCGEVHPKQIGSVAFMLAQGGMGVMLEQPLAQYGIKSTEHSPVDFTLSRNAETGAVTITYSSPKELPVKFNWTATVAVDGTVTKTPFTVTEAPIQNLSPKAAKAMAQDAAQAMGRNLSSRELSNAAGLTEGSSQGDNFGHVQLTRQMTVDLRPDIPVVTDLKVAQTLVA